MNSCLPAHLPSPFLLFPSSPPGGCFLSWIWGARESQQLVISFSTVATEALISPAGSHHRHASPRAAGACSRAQVPAPRATVQALRGVWGPVGGRGTLGGDPHFMGEGSCGAVHLNKPQGKTGRSWTGRQELDREAGPARQGAGGGGWVQEAACWELSTGRGGPALIAGRPANPTGRPCTRPDGLEFLQLPLGAQTPRPTPSCRAWT